LLSHPSREISPDIFTIPVFAISETIQLVFGNQTF
jgi:hypothetical protein